MEAAIKEEKKGKKKWLSRFLNFLMYGGWLVIAVLAVVVVLAFSALNK